MGRLSGDGKPRPRPNMGIMSPPVSAVKQAVTAVIRRIWRACDQCGYSEIDGQPIMRAKYQIEVVGGDLYLCTHHFRKHSSKILEEGYPIHNIEDKVASK
ncbi:MAG: DUF7455 domain-containing protein [Candidatus Saccharimonadales bacterium]